MPGSLLSLLRSFIPYKLSFRLDFRKKETRQNGNHSIYFNVYCKEWQEELPQKADERKQRRPLMIVYIM